MITCQYNLLQEISTHSDLSLVAIVCDTLWRREFRPRYETQVGVRELVTVTCDGNAYCWSEAQSLFRGTTGTLRGSYGSYLSLEGACYLRALCLLAIAVSLSKVSSWCFAGIILRLDILYLAAEYKILVSSQTYPLG